MTVGSHSFIAQSREIITRDDASHVLHSYGERGWPAGSFTTLLIETLKAADPTNMARLATVFPGPALAVHLARDHLGGIALLTEIAARGP